MLPLEIVTPVPATGLFTLAWLLIAIPAASSAVLLLVGRRADRWAPYLGAAAPLASFAIGLYYFVESARPRRAGRGPSRCRCTTGSPAGNGRSMSGCSSISSRSSLCC